MKKYFAWIEIPVSDMDRACNFYNNVFDWQLTVFEAGPLLMAALPPPSDDSVTGGALVMHKEAYKVSANDDGPVIYLEVDKIEATLAQVENFGGQTIMPKKLISPDNGSMALFRDCEGNRMALHSLEIN